MTLFMHRCIIPEKFIHKVTLSMINKLQDLNIITENDVNAALLRNDPEELQIASLTLALSDLDSNFTQAVCIRLCSSENNKVRGNALVSLGHLARRFRHLEEQAVRPIIEAALQDADGYVRMSAKSAADEIHQFLHWQILGHQYG
jgi:HEAT repeat protein